MLNVTDNKANGTIKEILECAWAASLSGMKADPTDAPGCDLAWNGTAWAPGSGTGLGGQVGQLSVLQGINLSKVASGVIFMVGAEKYRWNGSTLAAVSAIAGDYSAGERVSEGVLAAVLATSPPEGTWSEPTDAFGCRIQYKAGKWFGDFGTWASKTALTTAIGGQEARIELRSRATLPSGPVTWRGAIGGGWVSAYPLDADALMCFGDSIVAAGFVYGQNPSGTGTYLQLRESMETIMNRMLGFKRFRRLYNYGYAGFAGSTFSYQPGDAWYDPAYDGKKLISENNAKDMVLAFGTNDISNESMSPEQICANLSKIATWGTEYGKRVHIRGVLPRGTGYSADSATRRARALRLNQLLKTACRKNNWHWIPVVDAFASATSTTEWSVPWGTTGLELLWDGVHPSSYGNYVGALVMRDHFNSIRSDRKDIGASHYLDSVKNDATSIQLVKNPRFNGTTDWILPQPGGVFTSVVYSTIPSPDGVGNALAVDLQYSGAGSYNIYQMLDTISVAKGQYVGASAAILLQGLNGSGSPIGYYMTSLCLSLDYTDAGSGQSLGSTASYGISPAQNRYEIAAGLTVIDLAPITPALDVLPGRAQRIDVVFTTKSAGSCRVVVYGIQATLQEPLYGAIPWRP